MQETLRQDSVSRGLRRRRGSVPALRQQEGRTVVGLLGQHRQKGRSNTARQTLHQLCAIEPQGYEEYRILKYPNLFRRCASSGFLSPSAERKERIRVYTRSLIA